MISADSIKAKLKNQAKKNGRLFQDELIAYCLERTIYRISISRYNENFTLKGGIFLYAIFNGEFSRATRDIDLLARALNNEVEAMTKVFEEIFAIEPDDAIKYKKGSLAINRITEFKEFPVLLEMDTPIIYAYSLASVVAEKFEAIVSLGYANSRYKDFYDIYILSHQFDFNGLELRTAIVETFKHRKTSFDDIVIFEEGYSEDRTRNSRWRSFVGKKRALIQMELSEVIDGIHAFLSPIIKGIRNETDSMAEWKWKHMERKWWS